MFKINHTHILFLFVVLSACNDNSRKEPDVDLPKHAAKHPTAILSAPPVFNKDSAYSFVHQQVDFGPRVPNTAAHQNCADYLQKKLASYGFNATIQQGMVKAYTGKKLQIKNIIGRYKPEKKKRILFCAHWDTRPYADRDTKNRTKPIDGANDGASGVGVLLEIARSLSTAPHAPRFGLDIIFFDAEDYGQPQGTMMPKKDDTWCLGSQFWANHIPWKDNHPEYAVLLDMVGSADAVFPKEGASMYYAPHIVNKIWGIAKEKGYGNMFIDQTFGGLTDDHLYINELTAIPCIDIIHYDLNRNDFGTYHHTHRDNMAIIDKSTLEAVGSVLLETLYREY